MKRLIFALSLAFLVGLSALSGPATHVYGSNNSSEQAQLAAHGSYRTVEWHRHHYWRDDRDFDRPYVRHYYYYDGYYDPYYDYHYPYTYYYGPGFSVNTPFFGINIP
ncbi:MAG: hypothetical protein ABSG91_03185 [Syntrophobacteraceae bacterium]|jgi:hypothetical protein